MRIQTIHGYRAGKDLAISCLPTVERTVTDKLVAVEKRDHQWKGPDETLLRETELLYEPNDF